MKKSAAFTMGLVLVAGSVLASNTGFKLNYSITKPAKATNSNNAWMSFPYFYYPDGNVGDTGNSIDLCRDLNEGDLVNAPKVLTVVKWDTLGDKPVNFGCKSTFNPFVLNPGEGYSMKPTVDQAPIAIKVY